MAIEIGLFGFGVVGESLYKVIQQTPSLNARIHRICIKNANKKRSAPAELFTTDAIEILHNENINTVVELIDDADAAYTIIKHALTNGKNVVTANKKVVATHLLEFQELQKTYGASLLYEAAVCASIPIIRNLEEYYDNDLLTGLQGIVNGSTNYILTQIIQHQKTYGDALLEAQQLGFAESNPWLDVSGTDAAYKWCILLHHAYGINATLNQFVHNGIEQINATDAEVAKQKNWQIKLVAQAIQTSEHKVVAFVLPSFVTQSHPLSFVQEAFNGLLVQSSLADEQFFYGKGAGGFPTASAVLSDIAALRYNYKYEHKKSQHAHWQLQTKHFYLHVCVSYSDIRHIKTESFEWIDEYHNGGKHQYIIGVLSIDVLTEESWWKENGNSLLLLPNGFIEEIETRKIKKRSLELAGL